jgi:cell division septation protein DedD
MFGIKGSRWFVLCVFLILCASATGAVAAGPVPEPPTCITVLPAISTACPSPSQSQTSRVASAEGGQSSQARALSVTATPSPRALARRRGEPDPARTPPPFTRQLGAPLQSGDRARHGPRDRRRVHA